MSDSTLTHATMPGSFILGNMMTDDFYISPDFENPNLAAISHNEKQIEIKEGLLASQSMSSDSEVKVKSKSLSDSKSEQVIPEERLNRNDLKSDVYMDMNLPPMTPALEGFSDDSGIIDSLSLTIDQKSDIIEKLNQILKGELAAVETYQQVLEKSEGDEHYFVQTFLLDHKDAVEKVRRHIFMLGGEAEESSGAWGFVAQSVTSVAKIFGDKMAIRALEEGEEIGLGDYESLRDFDNLPEYLRQDVEYLFIPKQRRHIEKLSALLI